MTVIWVREFSSSLKRTITDPWVKEWTNHLTDGPEISLFVYYFKPFYVVFSCVRLWHPSKHSSLINVRIWRMVKRQIYPLCLCLDTRSSSVKLDGGWGSPYQPAAKLEREASLPCEIASQLTWLQTVLYWGPTWLFYSADKYNMLYACSQSPFDLRVSK